MKAAELYRLLATNLGPSLVGRGFKKLRGSRLAFQRVVRDTYLPFGSIAQYDGIRTRERFFANFTVSESPTFDTLGRHDQSLFFFLTDAELAGARDFRDAVVARIPRPPASYFETFQAECDRRNPENAAGIMAAIRGQFEPEPIHRLHQTSGCGLASPD